jgi:hypothetical protein
MASKAEDSSSSAENSLRCSICLDDFKDPKVLPCCHTFCKHCLEKIVSKDHHETFDTNLKAGTSEEPAKANSQCDTTHQERNEEVAVVLILTCPQCRAQHKLTGEGVEGLLTNYAIEDELGKIKTSSCQEENVESSLHCDLCESTDPVVSFCNNCSVPLCEFCHKAHQRLKQYYGHAVKSVGEIDSQLLSRKEIKRSSHLVCSKHPTQVPQIFCSSCDELVCCECVVKGHEGHKFVGINSETRLAMEKKLSDASSSVCTVLEVFKKDLEYVETVEKVTNSTGMENQADIKKMFDEFISILQKRRDDLLAKSEERNNAKLKLIWSEKDFLEQTIAKLTTTLSFSKRVQTCKDDGEYLSLGSQALLSLRDLKGSSWDSKTVKEIDLQYVHVEKKVNEPAIFKTAIKFEERRNKKLKLAWKNFPAQVDLGKEYVGTLSITRDDTQHPYVLHHKPTVTILHVNSVNCPVARTTVHRSTTFLGVWDVTFTLYCGGCHHCGVHVDGAHMLVNSVEVAGTPPLESRIMRGPGWNYQIHDYGASKSDVGLVISHNASEETISVQWQDGNGFDYLWGASGKFDIQLYH